MSGMPASRPMAAVDAQTFWMSAKIPNDQFLLFAFAGSLRLGVAIEELRRRAEACGELRLRVVDDCHLRYPRWVDGAVTDAQFTVSAAGLTWQECLDRVGGLAGRQLDIHEICWRVHIFPEVTGIPGAAGVGSVAVVQMSHALGDGTRSAALAGVLFGRLAPVPVVLPDRGCLVTRAVAASRAHGQWVSDIEAGRLPPPTPPRPVLSINSPPFGGSVLRTLSLPRGQLAEPTVTIGAMVVISAALGGYLGARGEDVSQLGAEVPMRNASNKAAHNNFRNVGVGLYPGLGRADRAARIAAELVAHRARGSHPAMAAASAAFAAIPAPLLRWGVRQFDPTLRSPTVTGNTVVSSVNRGPADLFFGGCPVLLTAGYPTLSPMMSLTHGVHGIGDTVAVSVHADPANIDVDEYVDRLESAIPLS